MPILKIRCATSLDESYSPASDIRPPYGRGEFWGRARLDPSYVEATSATSTTDLEHGRTRPAYTTSHRLPAPNATTGEL